MSNDSGPDGARESHDAHDEVRADVARRAELDQNLAALRARIDAACDAAGRDRGEVALIAVTKFFPAQDVLRLMDLGLLTFGENRDQEASAKAAQVAEELLRRPRPPALALYEQVKPIWHFIGQLQSNKVRSVVSYADVIQSVDRLKLVAALDEGARRAGRTPACLVQVNLDPDAAGRGGAEPGDVERIADAVARSEALRLGGVMAVAPLGGDPRAAFERLAEIADKVRGAHAEAVSLSAGMSGDLEAAVAAGATHVRVGSALLGRRPPLR